MSSPFLAFSEERAITIVLLDLPPGLVHLNQTREHTSSVGMRISKPGIQASIAFKQDLLRLVVPPL